MRRGEPVLSQKSIVSHWLLQGVLLGGGVSYLSIPCLLSVNSRRESDHQLGEDETQSFLY